MNTLDRYIVRTFLSTAALFFLVLILLRIVVDLFLNMDEFTEQVDSFAQVLSAAWSYYSPRTLVYFIELGGVIIVASAVFSLARMNHTNELTAMLASGVSLHRTVWPIIVCSMFMGGLIIVDQELLVPPVAHRLVRERGEGVQQAQKEFLLPAMSDGSQATWYSPQFRTGANTMERPLVLIRSDNFLPLGRIRGARAQYGHLDGTGGWWFYQADLAKINRAGGVAWPANPSTEQVRTHLSPGELLRRDRQGITGSVPLVDIGKIQKVRDKQFGLELVADRFVPDPYQFAKPRTGRLVNPRFVFRTEDGHPLGTLQGKHADWTVSQEDPSGGGYWKLAAGRLFLASDLTPRDLVLRQATGWISYMSTADLTRLLRLKRIPNEKAAVLTLHIRVANPINNLVMLLLGLPFILSRQRNIKTSAGLCVAVVGTFYVFIYVCRYLDVAPVWSAWTPILVFGPLSVVMLDAIKT